MSVFLSRKNRDSQENGICPFGTGRTGRLVLMSGSIALRGSMGMTGWWKFQRNMELSAARSEKSLSFAGSLRDEKGSFKPGPDGRTHLFRRRKRGKRDGFDMPDCRRRAYGNDRVGCE